MKVTAHEPDFCPYLGLFERIYYADLFVVFDNVQYQFGYLNNRNKVKTAKDNWSYITIPVHAKFGQNINEVELVKDNKAINKILKTLENNYSKTKFFNEIYPDIKSILCKDYKNLAELNIELYKYFIDKFGFNVKIVVLSTLPINSKGEQQVIDMCKYVGCTEYISGVGGKNYQNEENFVNNGVKLTYVDFTNFKYPQNYKSFIPYMSVLDYVFNCGFEIPKEWKENKIKWQKA